MEERRLSGEGKQKFQLTNSSLYYPEGKPSQEWFPPTSAVQQGFLYTKKKDRGLLAAKPPGLHSLLQGAIGTVVNVFLPYLHLELNQTLSAKYPSAWCKSRPTYDSSQFGNKSKFL